MTVPNPRLPRLAIIFSTLIATIGCDQASKHAARLWLAPEAPHSFFKGALKLVLLENAGGFLSLGAELPEAVRFIIFSAGVGLAVLCTLLYIAVSRRISHHMAFACSLMIGGGMGNLIDRLLFSGVVTDFMTLSVGRFRTGIFNVADVAVMAGAALLVLGRLGETRAKAGV